MLQALEVSHSFGDRVVLDEVTLRVRPGVLTGLLGPNGAGKTTLLRLLLGVIEADAGRFVLNGAPVTAAERQRWGYMPQERGLYPAMATGAQVVYFGRLHGLSGADATRRARDLLAEVGLSDRWGERTDRLSGGQQQRLQLATSLVHDPQIIVLDEPFAGLDPVAVADLSHTLTDRVRHGRTVLLSSHQLDLVQELCEEIVMIDRGRTVLEGAVADLRSSSGSRQLRLVLVPPADGVAVAAARRQRRAGGGRRASARISAGSRPVGGPRRGTRRRPGHRLRPRPAHAVPAVPRRRGPRRDPRAAAGRNGAGVPKMRTNWWGGTWLVARRALAEGFASRSWRIVTALMLAGGLAVVVIPRVLGDQGTRYTLASVGPAPEALRAQLDAAGKAADFSVDYKALPDVAAVRDAVREGQVDAGLSRAGTDARIYVQRPDAGIYGVLSAALSAQAAASAMEQAGLTPSQIAQLQDIPLPEQVIVGPVRDQARAGIGFAAGVVLYIALLLVGTGIATTVATEKSTRVSEVLLSVLRPTQLLVGTVLGAGLLGLVQVAALAVPAAASLLASHRSDVPSSAAADVALAIVWFVLGLGVYAFVFAALGALVDKVTEVSSALMPVQFLLIGAYMLSVLVVVSAPTSWASVAASLFPLTSPIVMPMRWASGMVSGWELVLSMTLAVAAAVLLARFAALVYRRGVVRTGQRVKLRQVLRPQQAATASR